MSPHFVENGLRVTSQPERERKVTASGDELLPTPSCVKHKGNTKLPHPPGAAVLAQTDPPLSSSSMVRSFDNYTSLPCFVASKIVENSLIKAQNVECLTFGLWADRPLQSEKRKERRKKGWLVGFVTCTREQGGEGGQKEKMGGGKKVSVTSGHLLQKWGREEGWLKNHHSEKKEGGWGG